MRCWFFSAPWKSKFVSSDFLIVASAIWFCLQKLLVLGVGDLDLVRFGALEEGHDQEHQQDDRRPAQDDLQDLVPVEVVVRP